VAEVPTFDKFMNPVLEALHVLGGSGTIEEINNRIYDLMKLSTEQLAVIHDPERGSQTQVDYRIAWARTYLKKYSVLENSSRGIWALSAKGRQLGSVNPQEVRRFVQSENKAEKYQGSEPSEPDSANEQTWRNTVMQQLLTMEPSAFERLVQRLLRESGFIQVEVTGRSGDRGIDGKGIMRLGGLLSFHVIFQCKRYQGSVPPKEIRDFRGALVGRADKGLFVTTGSYTKEALLEATRDGAPAIDLLDGNQLIDKLKELGLGIKTDIVPVEQVTVDQGWFTSL
jgi:restriction system protein